MRSFQKGRRLIPRGQKSMSVPWGSMAIFKPDQNSVSLFGELDLKNGDQLLFSNFDVLSWSVLPDHALTGPVLWPREACVRTLDYFIESEMPLAELKIVANSGFFWHIIGRGLPLLHKEFLINNKYNLFCTIIFAYSRLNKFGLGRVMDIKQEGIRQLISALSEAFDRVKFEDWEHKVFLAFIEELKSSCGKGSIES